MYQEESAGSDIFRRKNDKANVLFLLVLIIVAGFALRLCWLLYAQPVPVSDFLCYKTLAENLWDKGFFGIDAPTALRTPGYPFFLAGCMAISRSDLWLQLVNICLSIIICIEVYFVAAKLFHRRAAVWATLLCAFNPAFVLFSPVLASEHLFTALVLGSLLIIWPSNKPGLLRISLSGLLLGLAILVRGEGLFYIPLFVTLAFWPMELNGQKKYFQRICKAAMLLVVTICCLVPWYLRNTKVIGPGAGLSTTAGLAFYYGHNPIKYGYFPLPEEIFGGRNEVERHQLAYQLGLEHIKEKPASILHSIFWGTIRLYEPSTYGINWSTRSGLDTQRQWITKDLPGRLALWVLSIAVYLLLLVGVLLSLIYRQDWTKLSILVIGGVIFLNWTGLAVMSLAIQRYHYFVEIFFCIVSGTVLARFFASNSKYV